MSGSRGLKRVLCSVLNPEVQQQPVVGAQLGVADGEQVWEEQ